MQLKEQIILHVDANSFYASVECARHPELKDKPVAVSGNPEKRNGIILTKNDIAKKFGVATGEPIWQAKDKCPDLICIYPDMPLYEKYSKQMREIFKKYTFLIEGMGLDECWLDISASAHLFGGANKIAEEIRKEIKSKLNITVSVGISFCKLFAKLGSDLKKPDAQTEISRDNFKQIVYPLPINAIIGIGRRMTEHLNKMNIFTLGDLVNVPGYILKKKFNINIYELRKKLMGYDHDKIASIYDNEIPKSIGNGTTTLTDIFSEEEIETTITFLSNNISSRLRDKNVYANRIDVTIKDCHLKSKHASKVLPKPINSMKDIVKYSMLLVNEFWPYAEKIRAIRVSCSKLTSNKSEQLNLFHITSNTKQNSLNTAIDEIRKKYGKKSIQPAVLMQPKIVRENFNMQDDNNNET